MKKVKFLQAKTQKSFPKHFVTACISVTKLCELNKKFPKTTIICALCVENQHITPYE